MYTFSRSCATDASHAEVRPSPWFNRSVAVLLYFGGEYPTTTTVQLKSVVYQPTLAMVRYLHIAGLTFTSTINAYARSGESSATKFSKLDDQSGNYSRLTYEYHST